MGNISSIPKEKIFGVHIRYAKTRRAIATERLTINYTMAVGSASQRSEPFDYEQVQGLPWA